MKKAWTVFKSILVCLMALCIPGLLVFNAMQARKYAELEQQVLDLEKRQSDLVEENKKLITDISILSRTDRIERIAEDELGMRKAETAEILRVEMKEN